MADVAALKALLAKVEAGQWPGGIDGIARQVFPYRSSSYADHGLKAVEAFDGSLDAAEALHDAVVPGWTWKITDTPDADLKPPRRIAYVGHAYADSVSSGYPSRAWLIAILKALIAEAEA